MMQVAVGRRVIENGKQYDHLFPAPIHTDPFINQNGDVDYTLAQMGKMSGQYKFQTEKIARLLKGATTYDTCRNIWDFVFRNIQYKQDKLGVEQLRTPARTWADRQSGVDCDCMSIFISSILKNLNIQHRFRVANYSPGEFEHVYIIVPKMSGHIILDAVIHKFDYEKEFHQAKDYSMQGIPVQTLNGLPVQTLNGSSYSQQEVDDLNKKIRQFLKAQLTAIKEGYDVMNVRRDQAVNNLQFALQSWDNSHNRYETIKELASLEQQYNPQAKLFRSILSFFDGQADCHKICTSGYVKLPDETISRIQNGSLDGITNDQYGDPIVMREFEHKINRNMSLLIAARGAFLTLVRLNVWNLADKLAVGFFPVNVCGENFDGQWFSERTGGDRSKFPSYNYNGAYSRAFGLTASDHLDARRKLYDKILRRWNNLGGDWDGLKNPALKGAHKMLDRAKQIPGFKYWCLYNDRGLSAASGTNATEVSSFSLTGLEGENNGLGEVVAAAIITAAATVLAALGTFIVSIKQPGNATIDTTSGSIPSNPVTNPDPTGHPDAEINPETGLWTSIKTGEHYDPSTGQWVGNGAESSFKKFALVGLGIITLGVSAYFAFFDKPTKKGKKDE